MAARARVRPPSVAPLRDALGIDLDLALLEQALTHRSYANEQGGLPTNERLEFLGDAVLALVVGDIVFTQLPDEGEGALTRLLAAVVQEPALADVAREIGLGSYVRLGRGESQSGGDDKDSILADTLEAIVGAVYVAGGLPAADRLVRSLVLDRLTELHDGEGTLHPKTSLQELVAERFGTVPTYIVEEEEGPSHRKQFTVRVEVAGDIHGHGQGPSKKKAEQAAAEEAYRRLTQHV